MHPFLADMPTTWLRRVSLHAAPILRPNGRRLFREDGVADKFWLVCAGDVALDFHVPGRGDVVIEHVRTGGVVGWSWQIAPYRWTLGGVVAEKLHALHPPTRRNMSAEPGPPARAALSWRNKRRPRRRPGMTSSKVLGASAVWEADGRS